MAHDLERVARRLRGEHGLDSFQRGLVAKCCAAFDAGETISERQRRELRIAEAMFPEVLTENSEKLRASMYRIHIARTVPWTPEAYHAAMATQVARYEEEQTA